VAASYIPGIFVEFGYRGKAVRFFVRNVADIVQSAHANGCFSEEETLVVIERYLKPSGVFLDVGANVGNHAVFAAMFGSQGRVIVIEPNPEAITLLKLNLLLNRLALDVQHLGVGLSDHAQAAEAAVPRNNLGGAKMIPTEGGSLRLVTGDSLLAGGHVDFIKIDVEGHEMAALAGLAQTIEACRPIMFVEVDTENREAFGAWLAGHGYETAHAFPRYARNQNFLIRPKGAEPLPGN
jgi:FkbM family methyltransferase